MLMYYILQSLALCALMAGYGVLAFNQQDPCFSNDGLWTNVQHQMRVTFIANFLLHAIQFIVSTAIGPH